MSIDQEVQDMRRMAEYLLPFQKSSEDEVDFAWLKTREINFNGYYLTCFLTKISYEEFHVWSLQLYSRWQPFVPFNVVCQCAISFLSNQNLGLSEMIVFGRKVYVWNQVVGLDGKVLPLPDSPQIDLLHYDGLDYFRSNITKVLLLPS